MKSGDRKRKKMKIGDRKREKMQSNSPPSVDVNEDLMKEILLKLPIKSVLRFKGLSKSWFSAISDPQFARRHFDAAVAPTHKLLHAVPSSDNAYCADTESELRRDSLHKVYNFPGYRDFISVVGSCRGFVLLQYVLHEFVMWNPLTDVQKKIHFGIWGGRHHLSGMGYDPVDDDIVLVSVTLTINDDNPTLVRYFSLRNNCWTSDYYCLSYAHEPKFEVELGHGQFWNGALYWIVKSADKRRNVVIAFDVREKRLSEIPLPNHLAILPKRSDIYYLKVMGEYLSLCMMVRNQTLRIEIWSMKEYTEETVWTKTFVFSPSSRILSDLIFPICFTENGEILAFCGNDILVKIDEKGKLRYGVQCISKLHFLRCGMYREFFLPLPRDSEEEKLSTDEYKDLFVETVTQYHSDRTINAIISPLN